MLGNQKVAQGHFVITMSSPYIAREAKPGQFVQVVCSNEFDPLLPRPFSFLTVTKNEFSLLYQVVGKGTQILSEAKKDDMLWVLGPLGNGFSTSLRGSEGAEAIPLYAKDISRKTGLLRRRFALPRNDVAILVGGGVGIPPLYHLAQKLVKDKISIHVFLGARNKNLLLCEKDFRKLNAGARLPRPYMYLSTDDGSKGYKGLVTGPLEDFLKKINSKEIQIYTCGPTPMLKAVSLLSQKYGIDCQVSVEEPMACGFGVCLGCAIKVKGPRFAMACTQGPVFKADEILWE